MSARCSGQVFERYPVGGGEFVLALALADNAHDDGTNIFISVEKMAAKSRQSVRAVQGHLRAMQDRGWLLKMKAGGGRGHWVRYRISADWLNGADLAPFKKPQREPSQGSKGADSAGFRDGERVQNDALKGADCSTPYRTEENLIPPYPPPGGARVDNRNPETPGSPGFDAVSAAYPRRDGMDAARRAWNELAPDELLQAEIARAIQAWIPSEQWHRDSGRWIPKFGKFLRDQRWLDAPATTQPAASVVVPMRAPKLTPEQLQANGAKARALVAQVRAARGGQQQAGGGA